MSKKLFEVWNDRILIDMDLLFQAIREQGGDWEKVERDIRQFLTTIQGLGQGSEE